MIPKISVLYRRQDVKVRNGFTTFFEKNKVVCHECDLLICMIYGLHRAESNDMKPDFRFRCMKFCSKVNGNKDPCCGRQCTTKKQVNIMVICTPFFAGGKRAFLHLVFQDQLFCFLRTLSSLAYPASARKKLFISGMVIHSLILTYKAIKTRRMGGKEFVYNMFLK